MVSVFIDGNRLVAAGMCMRYRCDVKSESVRSKVGIVSTVYSAAIISYCKFKIYRTTLLMMAAL